MDEREANEIPKGARWLWDWKWWVSIVAMSVALYLFRFWNGTI